MNGKEARKILKDARNRIFSLMSEERWVEAHRACLEILRFDPDNIKIIRLKNKIEKEVRRANQKAIKDDLTKLEPFWKEKKYEELLANLKNLEPYIEDYPPLKKIILKAGKAYKKQIYEQQIGFFQTEMAAIRELMRQGLFQEAVRRAEKLRILKINEDSIKKLLKELREKWIDNEIGINKPLIKSEKYEDILIFYQGLYRIDNQSKKVKNIIEKTKQKYLIYKIEQKRELIYKSVEEMKTLFQLKKFEQAAQVAMDILEIDPRNREVKYLLPRAKKKAEKESLKEIARQIKSSSRQMEADYKKDKSNYLKI